MLGDRKGSMRVVAWVVSVAAALAGCGGSSRHEGLRGRLVRVSAPGSSTVTAGKVRNRRGGRREDDGRSPFDAGSFLSCPDRTVLSARTGLWPKDRTLDTLRHHSVDESPFRPILILICPGSCSSMLTREAESRSGNGSTSWRGATQEISAQCDTRSTCSRSSAFISPSRTRSSSRASSVSYDLGGGGSHTSPIRNDGSSFSRASARRGLGRIPARSQGRRGSWTTG